MKTPVVHEILPPKKASFPGNFCGNPPPRDGRASLDDSSALVCPARQRSPGRSASDEVSRRGGGDERAGLVRSLDRKDCDAAAPAKDARGGFEASGADGAEEVYGQVNGDGVGFGFEQSEYGEGRGAVEQREDRAAVEDAAHARQLLARVEREGGRAALRPDELQAEQARVRDLSERLAEPREFGVRQRLFA